MSVYKKRRSDDESSERGEEFPPPLKKPRNGNGESDADRSGSREEMLHFIDFVTSPFQTVISWISNLQVNSPFKLAMLRQNSVEVIDSEDDNESEDLIVDPDDNDDGEIAVINDGTGLGSPHNNHKQSFFLHKARAPIPVFDSASNDHGVLYGRNSLRCTSPTFSTSISSSTAEEERYRQLLNKMIVKGSIYRPVKTSETAAIEVDLTQDEDEEAVMECYNNKDILQKPVNDYLEKYYKPFQFVKKTIVSPPKSKYEIQENIPLSASILPEYRPIKRKVSLFSDEWLKELKTSINDETDKCMEKFKRNEQIMNRIKEKREAKLKEEKLKFEKYKVPSGVFPEPGGGRNDYPGSGRNDYPGGVPSSKTAVQGEAETLPEAGNAALLYDNPVGGQTDDQRASGSGAVGTAEVGPTP